MHTTSLTKRSLIAGALTLGAIGLGFGARSASAAPNVVKAPAFLHGFSVAGGHKVKLQWLNQLPNTNVRYDIFRDGAEIDSIPPFDSDYTDDGTFAGDPRPNTTYDYQVCGENGAITVCSPHISVQTQFVAPAAPTNVTATYNRGTGNVDVTWVNSFPIGTDIIFQVAGNLVYASDAIGFVPDGPPLIAKLNPASHTIPSSQWSIPAQVRVCADSMAGIACSLPAGVS